MDAYAKLFPRASRSNKVGQRAARLRITGQRPFIAPIKYQESHSPPGSPRLSAYADAPLEAAWQLTNDSKSVCILARTLCDCETDCGLDHREDGYIRICVRSGCQMDDFSEPVLPFPIPFCHTRPCRDLRRSYRGSCVGLNNESNNAASTISYARASCRP